MRRDPMASMRHETDSLGAVEVPADKLWGAQTQRSLEHFSRRFLIEGTKPNLKKINEYVERSLMLVTALSPVIGYDKASKIAHYAMDNDLTLKAAALKLGFVTEAEFDRVVDPAKMVRPYVAGD